jgi:NADPH:quinone reductase-like Zn-dependent oxidoreductase
VKAVVFHKPGGIEELKYETVARPEISVTEVLVQVEACGVNHIDIWVRKGVFPKPYSVSLPHILGADVAGSVVEVGNAILDLKKGDRVVIQPVICCNFCDPCLFGRSNLCDSIKLLGSQEQGGYAEYVKIPRENVLFVPKGMSFEDAAALPITFGTAWNMLVSKAGVKPQDTVLVLAAGSGIGSAAVQIAKVHGAKVIATAGTDEKVEKARKLGADEAFNHYKQDIAEEARRLTSGRGVDVVVDHVGSATWEKSIRSLAKKGRLVSCGVTTGIEGKVDIRYLYVNELSIQGTYGSTKQELYCVLKLTAEGKIKPVIDRFLPLSDASEAHKLMEAHTHFGKIILKPTM